MLAARSHLLSPAKPGSWPRLNSAAALANSSVPEAIVKWNGSAWVAQNSGTTTDLQAVWGSDANNVWVVGASGTIL